MSLESGYTATLTIHRPGGDVTYTFETWEGGDIDSPDTKHRNAVTRQETARGGLRTRNNLTLSAECDAAMWAAIPTLEDSAGRDLCTPVRQMVDGRDAKVGKSLSLSGIIKSVSYPDYDLSSDDVGMLEVELTVSESAS